MAGEALEPVRKVFEEFHDLGNEQMRVAANEAGAVAKVTSGRLAAGSGSVIGLERCTRHRPSPDSSPALTCKPMKSLEYFSERL